MVNNVKIIAFYLPQYHAIPENDEWWGKDFTEWTNVKKSKPNYKGHNQPEVPLNHNYYNLLDKDAQLWQSNLGLKYGIDGFCYYHYWFNGKLLLEKPMENMLHNKDIKMPYCVCWANESWTRNWDGNNKKVLIKQEYNENYDQLLMHFNYMLPFFKDERYIKVDNKPMFIIYKPFLMTKCNYMIEVWNKLAKDNGFDGIYFGFQYPESFNYDVSAFDFGIEFEPLYTRYFLNKKIGKGLKKIFYYATHIGHFANKVINKIFPKGKVDDYDLIVKDVFARDRMKNVYCGAFTSWDNTPRRGKLSYSVYGSTPEKFFNYINNMVNKKIKNDNDFIFINAWNEWGEGAHLEPDELNGYGYLEAVKRLKDRLTEAKNIDGERL
ncbi:MAG: glycoside hydrolase family 99-like domain-containing protein [Clostridia bacterium]|nr:glycoside hydrolase family 99-like domain-containing protein [Clostridia bacterium]